MCKGCCSQSKCGLGGSCRPPLLIESKAPNPLARHLLARGSPELTSPRPTLPYIRLIHLTHCGARPLPAESLAPRALVGKLPSLYLGGGCWSLEGQGLLSCY